MQRISPLNGYVDVDKFFNDEKKGIMGKKVSLAEIANKLETFGGGKLWRQNKNKKIHHQTKLEKY